MKRLIFVYLLAPSLVLAQSSTKFELEAVSSQPTAQDTSSADFRIDGSLGNVFSQVSTSPCLEIAAGIASHRFPADLGEPFIDLDGDGLADGWEVYYFGNLAATGTDDNDGDGDDNATEQAAATNPLLFASIFRMTAVDQSGSTVSFSWTGGNHKPYEIEYSPDLGASGWNVIGTATSNGAGVASFTDTNPARTGLPEGFYRAVLVRD